MLMPISSQGVSFPHVLIPVAELNYEKALTTHLGIKILLLECV